jgi:hypothetical protein
MGCNRTEKGPNKSIDTYFSPRRLSGNGLKSRSLVTLDGRRMKSNITLVACLLLCSACGREDLGLSTVETKPSVIVITEGVVTTNSGRLHLQHQPLTVEQGELTPDMLQANGLLVSDGHAGFSPDTRLPQYYRCYLHKVHYPTNMTPNQVYPL